MAKILVCAIVFLILLGFVIWVVDLLKPKDHPNIDTLTQDELVQAQAELRIKARAVTNLEESQKIKKRLKAINTRLSELRDSN